ncbi:MAG TPA: SSI family serine proteinase inhibitor [Sporichthyaceae bacterium]|jgi:hypothetical protein
MRSIFIRPLAAGIGLAAALSVVPAAAASASTTHHHRYPATRLVLSVSSSAGKHTATLKCDPARGSHPHAADACHALALAHGKISKLHPREQFVACPMIYQPVTARATGVYRGHVVTYKRTFANECQLLQTTGSVFNLKR